MKLTAIDEMIFNVVNLVYYSKYYYIKDFDLKEDLLQEGRLAAYTLLASGEYDPTKDLRNYMYSWVWNAMSNYLYKNRKESHADLEKVENTEDISYIGKEQSSISINIEEIYKYCLKYKNIDDAFNEALIYFNEIGLLEYRGKKSILMNDAYRNILRGELVYKLFEIEEETDGLWR